MMACTEVTQDHFNALKVLRNGPEMLGSTHPAIITDLLVLKMIGHAFVLLPDGESTLEDLDEIDAMHRAAFPGGIAHPSGPGNLGKNWDGSERA
jgi:hypothetical protein